MSLNGRTALVTGGGQGIGAAIARQLVNDGANVLIFDLNAEPARQLSNELNTLGSSGKASSFEGSVLSSEDIASAFTKAESEFGGVVSLLVNNAGIGAFSLVVDTPEESWDQVVDVVLKGTFLVSKEFGNRLLPTGVPGSVVNISSLNWEAATEGIASYSAAKAGVVQLTNTLALEWGGRGIRVNTVAPGSIDTPMLSLMMTERMKSEFLSRTPLGRLGVPDDIAPVVSFLLSEEARWITAAVIPVDGGQHARRLQSYWDVLREG